MSSSSASRKLMPEVPRGRTREETSLPLPGAQAEFQWWDPAATQEAISRGYEVVRNSADISNRKNIALSVGKGLSYEAKVSEGMNRANGVHIQWDWVIAQLKNNPAAAALIVEFVTSEAGYEMPERRLKLTPEQRLRALMRELDESGKVGEDVLNRAAKRIGADKGAFRK